MDQDAEACQVWGWVRLDVELRCGMGVELLVVLEVPKREGAEG